MGFVVRSVYLGEAGLLKLSHLSGMGRSQAVGGARHSPAHALIYVSEDLYALSQLSMGSGEAY